MARLSRPARPACTIQLILRARPSRWTRPAPLAGETGQPQYGTGDQERAADIGRCGKQAHQLVLPSQAEDRGRNRAHGEQEQEAKRALVLIGMARCRAPGTRDQQGDIRSEHDQDGDQRPEVNHDVEEQLGFTRSAWSAWSARSARSEQPLVHREMAGTADRQEFRDALQESENQRVVKWNGSRSRGWPAREDRHGAIPAQEGWRLGLLEYRLRGLRPCVRPLPVSGWSLALVSALAGGCFGLEAKQDLTACQNRIRGRDGSAA